MITSAVHFDADGDADISRAEHAYRRLLDGIRAGDFRPGQRLREIDLATRLGVSRTPVREAIRRLASEGLVELAPGRGVMIIELTRQQVRELYFLRSTLEGAAARAAAQHASESEIAACRATLKQMAEHRKDSAQIARLNRDFHRLIHDAAHNRYLARALSQLADSLALLPGTTFQAEGRSALAESEHEAMLDAIENRDADRAERCAREHIDRAGMTRISMMFAGA